MEMNPLYYLNRKRIDLGTFYVHLMHGMFCPECGPFKPPFFDIRTPICEHYARDVTNTLYPNKHLYFLKINLRKLRLIGFPDPMESPSYLHNTTLLDRYSNISQIVNAPIINIPKPRKLPSTNPFLHSAQIHPQQHEVRANPNIPVTDKCYPLNIKEHVDNCEFCKGRSNLKCPFSLLATKQQIIPIYDLVKTTLPPKHITQLITKLNSEIAPSKRNKKAVTFNRVPIIHKLPAITNFLTQPQTPPPNLPAITNLTIRPQTPPPRRKLFGFKFGRSRN